MSKPNPTQTASLDALRKGGSPLALLLHRAEECGEALFSECSTSSRRVALTGNQLLSRALALSPSPKEDLQGQRVAVDPTGVEGLIRFFALLTAGAIPVLLDPSLSDAEKAARLEAANAREVSLIPTEGEPRNGKPAADRLILFTSDGTPVEADAPALARTVLRAACLTEKKGELASPKELRVLVALPLFTCEGLTALLWATLLGGILLLPADSTADSVLRAVRNHHADLLLAPPTVYEGVSSLLRQLLDGRDEKSRAKMEKALGKAGNGKAFGPLHGHLLGTELSHCFCVGGLRSEVRQVLASLGHPVSLLLGNDRGLLMIDRANANGYLPLSGLSPSLTEGELILREEGDALPIATGLAATPSGEGYRILGSLAHALTVPDVGTFYAEDVEQGAELPRVTDRAAVAAEGTHVLVLSLPRDLLSVQKQKILEASAALCAAHPTLSRVIYTHEPLRGIGALSVDRDALARRLDTLPTVSLLGDGQDDSEIHSILLEMFSEVLGCDPSEIDVNAHFMIDLGGNSLDYFTLVGEINERFGVTLQFEGESFGYSLLDIETKLKELVE